MRSVIFVFFFFKQKTAYEMRISDWSSDVCSSDLRLLWLHIERATAADKPRSPLRSAYPIGADLPDQLLQNFGAPILVPEGNLDFRISMQLSITANSNSRQMTGDLRDRFNCWYATIGRTILAACRRTLVRF